MQNITAKSLLFLLLCLSLLVPTHAAENQHPATDQTDPYIGLKDAEGEQCCHGEHCKPALYENRGAQGHFMSTDNGKTWFEVPAEREVEPTPSVEKLPTATWCGYWTEPVAQGAKSKRVTLCWVRRSSPTT